MLSRSSRDVVQGYLFLLPLLCFEQKVNKSLHTSTIEYGRSGLGLSILISLESVAMRSERHHDDVRLSLASATSLVAFTSLAMWGKIENGTRNHHITRESITGNTASSVSSVYLFSLSLLCFEKEANKSLHS